MRDDKRIQAEYESLRSESRRLGVPPSFQALSDQFADQAIWKSYAWLMDLAAPLPLGASVVDFGCKYGHALPLFLVRGAGKAIGVDVEDEYLEVGRRVVGQMYPTASFTKSQHGYIDLPPASADFVLVNEVISHVNPMYLPNVYAEIARILKPAGQVMISDGNNIANDACRRDLIGLYEAWENGPVGRNTGRDIVNEPFVEIRKRLIRERHPGLPGERVDYLAKNTSGLFGGYFFKVVDDYVAGGHLVERPYRPGTCPANPAESGVMIEFGFYPQQVELALQVYGIAARQLDPRPPILRDSLKRLIGSMLDQVKFEAVRFSKPGAWRGRSLGFQVLGVKSP